MSKTISELKLGTAAPIHIRSEATALDAMELMAKENISSLAIVDGFGTLQGNISMADIRFIFQHGRYNRLWMSCFSFMSSALSQKSLEADGRVSCKIPNFRIGSLFLM
jgi:predicted transcriptional regulator